jgi:hypothetical protein
VNGCNQLLAGHLAAQQLQLPGSAAASWQATSMNCPGSVVALQQVAIRISAQVVLMVYELSNA